MQVVEFRSTLTSGGTNFPLTLEKPSSCGWLFLTNQHLLFKLKAPVHLFAVFLMRSHPTRAILCSFSFLRMSLRLPSAFWGLSQWKRYENESARERDMSACALSHGRLVKANAVGLLRERGPAEGANHSCTRGFPVFRSPQATFY